MSFLDKLERRLGFIAIPGLIRARRRLHALVFVLVLLESGVLILSRSGSQRESGGGEVWRLVTYIFVPTDRAARPFLALGCRGALVPLVHRREGSRAPGGRFVTTLYFLVGMIGTTVAAVLFGASVFQHDAFHASLFFAFAHFYPDEVIYVFFILPLKFKWIAWIYAGVSFSRLRHQSEFATGWR